MGASRRTSTLVFSFLIGLAISGQGPATIAPDLFTEIRAAAGLIYVGSSWGAAWGDFDVDGYPDWLHRALNTPKTPTTGL